MNVIETWVKEKGKLHFTLIDPDKQSSEKARELASNVESWGSDAIMVGGSTVNGNTVDETCRAIKNGVKIPIILFPSSAQGLSKHADYIFFMSCLNSTRRKLLIEEQVKGALLIGKSGVKPIGMGYLLISTSKKPTMVEKVAKPDVIREVDIEKVIAYALTAQYLGMHCVYLEAGSGAERPVPTRMVAKVKKRLDIPLIVGGGMRTPEVAKDRVGAGADVIVTGTMVERDPEIQKKIIKTVKNVRT